MLIFIYYGLDKEIIFLNKKNYFISEIVRLTGLYQNNLHKKRNYKKKLLLNEQENNIKIDNLEKDLSYYRQKELSLKNEQSIQCDIDLFKMNKLIKNNKIVQFYKLLITMLTFYRKN